ncbi:DUF4381 domain-containing protein [Aromatoleum petrolei]|uniref:DUF4381 family protein n=1 Tax=Aromatoleum petrolei TaxID=76116 RepID=A0ABX1MQ52_9RHOO|nr:DUF4381 domain-containing protein [Aromatoleum petrolei]NMF88451.1 DUF4381 family protein [Aromatoleum petrolei]QTQ36974.1 putative protein DUF4381 [Aromatoleum petrolei]
MITASIDQLRDIHLPPTPGLWPPAPGWWILGAAALTLAVWFARHRRHGRPLRAALSELDAIARIHARTHDAVELARCTGAVLRHYAQWRFPHAHPAGLGSSAWLEFLDEYGGQGEFAAGAGAVLATLPYRPAKTATALTDAEARALLSLARRWLKANAPGSTSAQPPDSDTGPPPTMRSRNDRRLAR